MGLGEYEMPRRQDAKNNANVKMGFFTNNQPLAPSP